MHHSSLLQGQNYVDQRKRISKALVRRELAHVGTRITKSPDFWSREGWKIETCKSGPLALIDKQKKIPTRVNCVMGMNKSLLIDFRVFSFQSSVRYEASVKSKASTERCDGHTLSKRSHGLGYFMVGYYSAVCICL